MGQFLTQSNVTVTPLFEHWRDVTDQLPSVGIHADIEPESVQVEKGGIRRLILLPPGIFAQNCVRGGLRPNPIQEPEPGWISIFAGRLCRKTKAGQCIRWHRYRE